LTHKKIGKIKQNITKPFKNPFQVATSASWGHLFSQPTRDQDCQMENFHTKKLNFGKFGGPWTAKYYYFI
jgi:hypothetical protein